MEFAGLSNLLEFWSGCAIPSSQHPWSYLSLLRCDHGESIKAISEKMSIAVFRPLAYSLPPVQYDTLGFPVASSLLGAIAAVMAGVIWLLIICESKPHPLSLLIQLS